VYGWISVDQHLEVNMSNNKQSSVIKLLRLKEQLDSNPWQYNWIIEEIDEIIYALNNEEYDDHEQQ
jgi:hypothetical protein